MSNDLMNLHIEDGLIEISDRYADVIRDTRKERDQLRAEVEHWKAEYNNLNNLIKDASRAKYRG